MRHFNDHDDFFDDVDVGFNDTLMDAGENDNDDADDNDVVGSTAASADDNDVRTTTASNDAPKTPSDDNQAAEADDAVVRRECRRRKDRLADLVSCHLTCAELL